MITEFLKYIQSSKTKESIAFGHTYESISLESKEKRLHPFWASHLKNCHDIITTFTEQNLSKPGKILILGSGPTHEIPMKKLISLGHQLTLVDAHHPTSVLKKFQFNEKVNFVTHDLTECENYILEKKYYSPIKPVKFLKENFDLVISANVQSQLSLHIKKYFEQNLSKLYTEKRLEEIAEEIESNHFEYLHKFDCPVLFYNDSETLFYDKNGNLLHTEIKVTLQREKAHSEWIWNLAPIPEYDKEIALKMKIKAIKIK